jgi:hypothetical protein
MPLRHLRLAVLILAFGLAAPAPGAGISKRKRPAPRPKPTPIVQPGERYGPPTPPPLRAAGSCLRYEPGHYVVLAEVGDVGHVFKIDEATEITATLRKGARVRILYVEGIDGPIAGKIMPGPVEEAPAPRR